MRRKNSEGDSPGPRLDVERLERRTLFADAAMAVYSPQAFAPDLRAVVAGLATPSALQNPTVTATRPGAGETGVNRDAFVAADVHLPNSGHAIDNATLNASTVRLYKTSTGANVSAVINTSGGGDAIVLQPTVLLDANTSYTFEVTSGLRDTSGTSFRPYKATFTTGAKINPSSGAIAFDKMPQATSAGYQYTGVTLGPDGNVYAGTFGGRILRFTPGADGTLGSPTVIDTVRARNGGDRLVTGLRFDPASTASNLILWVSHGQSALTNADDWTGKLSKLTGSALQNYADVVIHLPRSLRDHLTNQMDFGPDGALYLSQGSNTAMGAPDNAWGQRPERLLSAAILRIDVTKITSTLSVKTKDGGGSYDPTRSGAPVTIFASGVRNAYDLVWHRNGNLYVPGNGSAAGGNTPGGGGAPALDDVPETQDDLLFRITSGGYYGHPNPQRGQYVLNGGNPTSGVDRNEVLSYPVGTKPHSSYKGSIYTFGKNYSPNGVIEYKGNAFGGALDGKLLFVRYSGGDDIIVLTPGSDGTILVAATGSVGMTGFNDPVDLAEDPRTGSIYVAEHGGQVLTLLRPRPGVQAQKRAAYFRDIKGGGQSATQEIVITNAADVSLTIDPGGIRIGGSHASQFMLVDPPALPRTLGPGQSMAVKVAFKAGSATTTGIKLATLTVRTTSSTRPYAEVGLRGYATDGDGGQNEPSLQRLLDLREIPVKVGDSNPADTALDIPPATPNDEVLVPRFFKAGPGNVTVEPIGVFSPESAPAARFGYYRTGNPSSAVELFTIPQGEFQSVSPTAVGKTSFDPGTNSFGLYTAWPGLGERKVFSEDALNTWESNSANRHKARFYPLKTSTGAVVPNAYVIAFEELTGAGGDYQDGVFIIRNVSLNSPSSGTTAAVTGLALVNAETGQDIGPLTPGMTINLAKLPTRRLNIRALTNGSIGSVSFNYDGDVDYRIENVAPYMIADTSRSTRWTPSLGGHSLVVTPHALSDARGASGTPLSVPFTVIDQAGEVSPGESGGPTIRVNFQPETSTDVPPGYRADIGRVFGKRSNGLRYGWSASNEASLVDRDAEFSPDQRYDTYAGMGDLEWAIAVTNGTYQVRVVMGDPAGWNSVYGVDVEGAAAVRATPSVASRWAEGTVTVKVTDGILSVRRAVGSKNNKLAFIEIARVA